jgi:hypothetical protein
VLFTEIVAAFYQYRTLFKTNVCDSIQSIASRDLPFTTVEGTLDFDYSIYALLNHELLHSMQQLFIQGKQMMSVSDEEIEAYQEERQKIKKEIPIDDEARAKKSQEIMQLSDEIKAAKKKQKIE